uniref:Putative secreted protein n=1 Tax=Ixodes ricinus TaxID=34613 RepID=A0A6B0U216_IXORI
MELMFALALVCSLWRDRHCGRACGQTDSCNAVPSVHGATPFSIMTQEGTCLRLLRARHCAALSIYATKSVTELFDHTSYR